MRDKTQCPANAKYMMAKIKQLRTGKNLSIRQASKLVGMRATYWWACEKCRIHPGLSTFLKMLQALGIHLHRWNLLGMCEYEEKQGALFDEENQIPESDGNEEPPEGAKI